MTKKEKVLWVIVIAMALVVGIVLQHERTLNQQPAGAPLLRPGGGGILTPTVLQTTDVPFTNAQVVALGAQTTGSVAIATIPAKTVVKRVILLTSGNATGTASLTASVGVTSATATEYLIAGSLKVATGTVYGDSLGEIGTSVSSTLGWDLESFTTTTTVYVRFVSTGGNLASSTGAGGDIYIETLALP